MKKLIIITIVSLNFNVNISADVNTFYAINKTIDLSNTHFPTQITFDSFKHKKKFYMFKLPKASIILSNINETDSTFLGYNLTNNKKTGLLSTHSTWFAAHDDSGKLYSSIAMFGQQPNNFIQGPLLKNGILPSSQTREKYERFFPMSLDIINNHKKEFATNGKVQNVHPHIDQWPAYEIINGEKIDMAKWEDANLNGIYDPENGDYPIIKGVQAVFYVFNDHSSPNRLPNSLPLDIQVNSLVYSYNCPNNLDPALVNLLDHSVFFDLEVINKSERNYTDATLSEFLDIEMASFINDYSGTIPSKNVAFGHSGYNTTDSALGLHKNSGGMCVQILDGPLALTDGIDNNNNGVVDELNEKCLLTSSAFFENTKNKFIGNPQTTQNFLALMQGKQTNGFAYKMYNSSGQVFTPRFHNSFGFDLDYPAQIMADSVPKISYDLRTVSNTGKFVFNKGQKVNYSFALYYSLDSNNKDQIQNLVADADRIKSVFTSNSVANCWLLNSKTAKKQNPINLQCMPNPASGFVQILSKEAFQNILVLDIHGRVLSSIANLNATNHSIETSSWPSGLYFVHVKCNDILATSKLVIEK